MPLYIWPPLCSLSCKRKEHKQDTLKIYIQGTNDNIHRTCIFKVLACCDPCQGPSLAIDIPIISVLFFFIRYITDTSFNLSELLLAGNHMDERIGMNAPLLDYTLSVVCLGREHLHSYIQFASLRKQMVISFIFHPTVPSEKQIQAKFCK